MKRDLNALTAREHDLLVIGGGITGAAAAREAARQGLGTAIIDRGDFAGATSANSLKIIHGGLRYLQKLDLIRTRQSACARRNMLQIAPNQVEPLRCLMPTRGLRMKGKPAVFMGLILNDILSCDRNQELNSENHIPSGQVISRADCLSDLPGINSDGVTGAAVWHDAIARDTEQVIAGMIMAAADEGAQAANYLAVTGFKTSGNRVIGVTATDVLTGESMNITAKMILNATGPWTNALLDLLPSSAHKPIKGLALGINFVLTRQLIPSHAAGLSFTDKTGNRLLFFCPWQNRTLVGTYYRSHNDPPGSIHVTDEDLALFIEDINRAYPPAGITRDDIAIIHAGLLPTRAATEGERDPALLEHPVLIDHAKSDGIEGLVTVLGVKYTTACLVARHAVRIAAGKLDKPLPHAGLDTRPLPNNQSELSAAELIRDQMPQTLCDMIFRRTGLAAAGERDPENLRKIAETMAQELGWDATRTEIEIRNAEHVVFPGSELTTRDP